MRWTIGAGLDDEHRLRQPSRSLRGQRRSGKEGRLGHQTHVYRHRDRRGQNHMRCFFSFLTCRVHKRRLQKVCLTCPTAAGSWGVGMGVEGSPALTNILDFSSRMQYVAHRSRLKLKKSHPLLYVLASHAKQAPTPPLTLS